MKKRQWLAILLIILGFTIFQINQAKAEELVPSLRAEASQAEGNTEGICHINNCFIPAPTIVVPENNSSFLDTRPIVRGLTWKRTLVDLYLDGEYQGPVLLKEHENYLQSFFWQPAKDLTNGQHYIFTIAYSTKGYDKTIKSWDQSKESTYIYFTVGQKRRKKIISPAAVLPTEKNDQQIIEQKNIIGNNQAEKDKENLIKQNSLLDKAINKEAEIATNYSQIFEKQRTKKVLLIIGLIIIGIIILIIIVNYLFRRKRKYLTDLMKKELEKRDDYPPPPPPINQNSLGI